MKEKNKTILKTLGVSALALTGLFAFSGCATDITLTQEQADKTIESVQNLDTNMQEMIEQNNAQNLKIEELVEQIKKQNEIIEEQSKAITKEQVLSKLQLATLRLMMNYNDIWDGLQMKIDGMRDGVVVYDTCIKTEDVYVYIRTMSDGYKCVNMNYEKDGKSGVLEIYNTDITESNPNGVGTSFKEGGDIQVLIASSVISSLLTNENLGGGSSKIDEDCVIAYEQKEDGTLFVDTFVQFIDDSGTSKVMRRYEISSDCKIISMEFNIMEEYYSYNEESGESSRSETLHGAEIAFTYNYEGINKEDYLQIVDDMKAKMPTV